jgi:hypothetical protein
MATLHELREITTPHRSFPSTTELWRWGGVDAVALYGYCPQCRCGKSGDRRVPNDTTEACTGEACPCHDEDAAAPPPPFDAQGHAQFCPIWADLWEGYFGRDNLDARTIRNLDEMRAPAARALWDDAYSAWVDHERPDPDGAGDEERGRWIAVETVARGGTVSAPAPEAVRSQSLRTRWGGADHFFTRNCFGRCSVCHEEMWDKDEQGMVSRTRPDGDPNGAPRRCAECAYWTGLADTVNDGTRVVVNGHHYLLSHGPASPHDPAYLVQFLDGRHVRGYLVAQGPIPHAWREKLPDNASVVAAQHRPARRES